MRAFSFQITRRLRPKLPAPIKQAKRLLEIKLGALSALGCKLVFILSSAIIASGCGYYYIKDRLELKSPAISNALADFKQLVVTAEQREVGFAGPLELAAAFKQEGYYDLLAALPESLAEQQKTLLVSAEIVNRSFWELEFASLNAVPVTRLSGGIFSPPEANLKPQLRRLTDKPVIVANAKVVINYKIRRGGDRLLLFDGARSISYQQVYQGVRELNHRPDAMSEIDRLIRLNYDRFAYELNFAADPVELNFEVGKNNRAWLRWMPFLKGNQQIIKAIRLAQGGNFASAITGWLVVAFEPADLARGLEVYLENRASSFFNIGQGL